MTEPFQWATTPLKCCVTFPLAVDFTCHTHYWHNSRLFPLLHLSSYSTDTCTDEDMPSLRPVGQSWWWHTSLLHLHGKTEIGRDVSPLPWAWKSTCRRNILHMQQAYCMFISNVKLVLPILFYLFLSFPWRAFWCLQCCLNNNHKGPNPKAFSGSVGEVQIFKMVAKTACAKDLFLQMFVCICVHDPCVWPVWIPSAIYP